jgi:hypothetical protein
MTLPETEKRRVRQVEDDERPQYTEKRPVVETVYTFRSTTTPRPPASVHIKVFKLGDIVSTSDGPHQVREIFWRSVSHADVLLQPLTDEERKAYRRSKP